MQHSHNLFLYFIAFLLCVISATSALLGPEAPVVVLAQTSQVYYVDNVSGSDANSGASAAPLKTISKASSLANPGDTIRIKNSGVSYQETISPTKSGSAGAPIIYEGWGGKPKFITTNTDPANQSPQKCISINKKDYITVRNIMCDGRGDQAKGEDWKVTGFSYFVQIYAGSYNNIENNEFVGALIGYPPSYHGNGVQIAGDNSASPIVYARYNKILNNKIVTTGYNAWHLIGISVYSSNNLVEGNELVQTAGAPGATHQAVQVLSAYNIVRNNRITNGSWTGVSFERYNTSSDGDHNVFEDNRVFDTYPGSQSGNGAMQMANQKAVIRRNFFYRNPAFGFGVYRGSGAEEARFLNQNHVYQNTFYKNMQVTPLPVENDATIKFAVSCNVPLGGNTNDNVIKNNIFLNNGSSGDKQLYIKLGCTDPTGSGTATVPIYGLNGMVIAGNSMLSPGGAGAKVYWIEEGGTAASLKTLSQAQSSYPSLVYQNIETDPLFTSPDAGTPDFTPRSGSPVVDKGVFLTKAYPAGSSSVRFLDPYYFIDGYGLISGDQIKFKTSGVTRRIISLDYNTGVATLDSAVSVSSAGDDVALVYNGNAPDIGAVETTYTAPGNPSSDSPPTISLSADPTSLYSGQSVTLTATAADDKGISGVQFRMGTTPQNQGPEDTSSPYQLTYSFTSAGTYTFSAVAKDTIGQTTTSNTVTVIVSSAPTSTNLQNLTFSFSTDTNRSLSSKTITVSILPSGSAKGAAVLESQTPTANSQNQVILTTTNRSSGSYDIRIKTPNTLSRKQTFTLANNQTYTFSNKLISGDINNDNAINSLDWSLMSPDWFQTNKTSDLNGDGITNALDFTWLNRNWFLTGE